MELTVGSEITSFTRKADFDAWNRYAAVNDEFVPLHMDDEAGRAAGFAGAIGMGNLSLAYLHAVLRDFIGEDGRIDSIEVNYRQPTLRKSTVTARGKIAEVTPADGGTRAVLDLWVDDDADRVLLNGRAVVTLAAR